MLSGPIDAHVHVWTADSSYPRLPAGLDFNPVSFTPEDFLNIAASEAVSRAVLVQVSFYGADHRFVLESLARHPGKFSAVALMQPPSENREQEMLAYIRQGVKGFRIPPQIHPSTWRDSGSVRHLWAFAANNSVLVCPLLNPEGLPIVDRFCEEFSSTGVVIDHFARIGMNGPVCETDVAALCRLARHPRVYLKVSAFYALGEKQPPYDDLAPLIRRVFEAFGPQRLMWGSDAPFQTLEPHRYRDSIGLVRDRLDFLSPADREWLLFRTAGSLFFSE